MSSAATLALLCLGIALLPERGQEALQYTRTGIAEGELWRLWSGHLVHFGWMHALANATVLWVLLDHIRPYAGQRAMRISMGLFPLLLSILLYLAAPSLRFYRGASGLGWCYGAWLFACVWAAQDYPRTKLVAIAVIALAWTAFEALGLGRFLSPLPAGIVSAWQIHIAGAGLGLLAHRLTVRNSPRDRSSILKGGATLGENRRPPHE